MPLTAAEIAEVKRTDSEDTPAQGERKVNEAEAVVARRIFINSGSAAGAGGHSRLRSDLLAQNEVEPARHQDTCEPA
jgi:hypothetical protein